MIDTSNQVQSEKYQVKKRSINLKMGTVRMFFRIELLDYQFIFYFTDGDYILIDKVSGVNACI